MNAASIDLKFSNILVDENMKLARWEIGDKRIIAYVMKYCPVMT